MGAAAQVPPSPSPEVRRQGEQQERLQQERERAQRELLQPAPDVPGSTSEAAVEPWPAEERTCFAIHQVVLAGAEHERFRWILRDLISGPDPAVGRCLGTAGMNVAATRAQKSLVAAGYVTSRVLLGAQDVSGGVLTLTVVPGRIRSVRFAEGTGPRATAFNAVPARSGDILNLRDIEQGLENFKRVPTVQADIQIAPSDRPDESDLVISWQQSFPFRLTATADDSGTKSTGKYQGSVTVSYDHGWTLNDLFYVTLNHDLGGGEAGTGANEVKALASGAAATATPITGNRFAKQLYGTEQPTAEQIEAAKSLLVNTAQVMLDNNLGYVVPYSKAADDFLQTLKIEYMQQNGSLTVLHCAIC